MYTCIHAHTYETVALPRLSEFTAQQLVLTLHGYGQSGIGRPPLLQAPSRCICMCIVLKRRTRNRHDTCVYYAIALSSTHNKRRTPQTTTTTTKHIAWPNWATTPAGPSSTRGPPRCASRCTPQHRQPPEAAIAIMTWRRPQGWGTARRIISSRTRGRI